MRPRRGGRRPSTALLAGAGLLAAAAVLAFVVFRGEGGVTRAIEDLGGDPGPVHVHGLGVNPADGALFIATHTGLWRVDPGETTAERVSDRRQDTMGFTVVGPNRFLGSGHPDLREAREREWPPLLGLIESRDAGETWRPLSLLGRADFHVLRARGRRVYGYDVAERRLLLSLDGGRSWTERYPPAPLLDLAADPLQPRHLVATSELGLHRSRDGGRTWKSVGDSWGLLAWPRRGSLFLVDAGGQVLASRDSGSRWVKMGELGGKPAALTGTSGGALYAALHDGTVKVSRDSGRSWRVRAAPA